MKTLKLINLVLLLLFISCNNLNSDKKNNSDLLSRIKETKEIKVGYVSYPPGFIVDPNTNEKSGIFNDVLLAIAKDNDLKIIYKEEVTWATMIESLKTGRVDLIANPVWATNERKKNADFSTAVYYSPIGVYVRENDNRFDNDRSKINDSKVKIAGVDGEINTIIGREDFPKAQLKPFPNNIDVAQLFLEIESGRKDVTFAEPMFAYDYINKNPGKIKNIGKSDPIRSYPNGFMFKQNEDDFKEFLNRSINKLIENGQINEIIDQYKPFEGAIIKVTDSLARDIQ